MISRFVTSELLEGLEYFPVLGITGPRQVGKTTLSREIAKVIEKGTIYRSGESG
jgi:hypothetical protein